MVFVVHVALYGRGGGGDGICGFASDGEKVDANGLNLNLSFYEAWGGSKDYA